MNRFVQNIRHYIDVAIDRVRPFFPLNATYLLGGLGVISAVLLPAMAYAWWRHNPVTSSVTSNDQGSRNTTLHVEQSAPAKIDTKLHVDAGSSDASSDSTNRSKTSTQVYVNGEEIPLPPDGTVHKEISSANGKTSVDISVNSVTSGTSHSSSHSSTNIELNSQAESESTDVD